MRSVKPLKSTDQLSRVTITHTNSPVLRSVRNQQQLSQQNKKYQRIYKQLFQIVFIVKRVIFQ